MPARGHGLPRQSPPRFGYARPVLPGKRTHAGRPDRAALGQQETCSGAAARIRSESGLGGRGPGQDTNCWRAELAGMILKNLSG
jgi:hypothetical protein